MKGKLFQINDINNESIGLWYTEENVGSFSSLTKAYEAAIEYILNNMI